MTIKSYNIIVVDQLFYIMNPEKIESLLMADKKSIAEELISEWDIPEENVDRVMLDLAESLIEGVIEDA